ncbi:Uma2 family endonuclease [Acaryochloris sp. IP29b_bin.137]|nr:Uma2 family endonuclease [Acaryochloris sp. IP29b_bin.137]
MGWFINPEDKQVEIYRPDQTLEVLQAPNTVSSESVLPGLSLYLEWMWL